MSRLGAALHPEEGYTNLLGTKSLSESSKSLSSNSSSISARSLNFNQRFLNLPTTELQTTNLSLQSELITCPLCKKKLAEPKLLNCLHVFCKSCLIAHTISESGDSNLISCPKCKQETQVNGPYGVDSLEDDYVMHNILDMIAIEEKMLDCTSCKTDSKSVARCSDCAQFLCPNCVSAHQYMRCFENHSVVKFDDIKNIYRTNLNRFSQESSSSTSPGSSKSSSSCSSEQNQMLIDCGVPIHKPLFCKQHTKESLKFFCNTCQTPICSDCVVSSHQSPMHTYERILDAESRNLEELDAYMKKAKENISFCQSEFQTLDQYLADLQEQLENSKGAIEETYQTYKVILERRKEELLKELEEKHTNKELIIMDLHNNIDLSINQLNDVIKFSERIIRNGNSSEILLLKKSIVNQIKHLSNTMPQIDSLDTNLKFVTDEKRFEKVVQETFGRFCTQKELKQTYLNNLQNSASSNQLHQLQQQQQQQQQMQQQEWLKYEQLQQQLKAFQIDDTLLKNFNQLNTLNGAPISPTSMNEEWLLNMIQKLPFEQQQQQVLSNSPKSANSWINNSSKQQHRPQSPFDSRSHTPAGLMSSNLKSDLAMNGLGSASSLGSSAGSSNNQNVVINHLDEFIPFANNQNLTQNLNQLSKFIATPGDLASLNNLNELALTAGLNMNGYANNDANSSSSQSPSMPIGSTSTIGTIGSGMVLSGFNTSSNTQTTFSGNGNLNPPVRQNGKMANMQIRTKFGTLGSGKAQFNSPHGFCLGIDEEIIVADTNNHRIQIFDKNGEFKYSFGSPGREEGQLWYPRKVTVMRETGKFVVCDRGNERSRMQIFNKNGHFLKKISIRYIDIVAGLAITQNGEIVAVDSVSPTVFRIAESGDLLKWFDCSDHMREPSDIAISGNEYFVCDFKGHCVAVFNDEGTFLRRIGGENITNFPNGIDVSDAGDVLVGDSHGNRFHVAVFSREGTMISEFECPYVKVSRCCGLKITSEGFVVTLAKNNHHVLVLNTLYVS